MLSPINNMVVFLDVRLSPTTASYNPVSIFILFYILYNQRLFIYFGFVVDLVIFHTVTSEFSKFRNMTSELYALLAAFIRECSTQDSKYHNTPSAWPG